MMTKLIQIQVSFALSILFLLSHSFAQGDAMFINSAGNVGIGTNSPTNRLSVAGDANFTGKVAISNIATAGNINISATGNADDINFKANNFSFEGRGNTRIFLKGDGVSYDIGINSQKFYLHSGITNSSGNGIVVDQNDNVGIGTIIPTNKLSVQGNANFSGNVGIGTNSPIQGKLVVTGNLKYKFESYSSMKKGETTSSTFSTEMLMQLGGVVRPGYSGSMVITIPVGFSVFEKEGQESEISIYAEKTVASKEFLAFSDSRIKKDFQKSDIAQDLETLRKIAITDYYYKDGLQHGFAQKKGIIAQEVEAVFPQAVNKHSDYITDIFAMPINTNLVETTLTVSMEKEHGLKNGDKVRLITPNEVAEVEIAVMNNKSFIVNNWDKKTSEVFVYGKLVDDFRSVDFDRLTILSISGVQQLCKEMEAMKAELQQTKDLFSKELAELKKDMQSLDAKVSNTKSNASR